MTNKRTTSSMKIVKPMNFPNVLGTIAAGKLLNLDILQIAVGTRPAAVHAGTPFDALVILQNAGSIEVDAVIRLLIPETDLSGLSGRITTKLTRPIRIGLRPGEVGCANLPVMTTAQTAPGAGYKLQLEIQVEQKQRGLLHVRDPRGGPALDLDELSEDRQQGIRALQGLNYSTETVGKVAADKATLLATFEVLTAGINPMLADLKPAYVTLWTTADYIDRAEKAEKTQAALTALRPKLDPSAIFFPLLRTTQVRFEAVGFRLWAGEAIAISKMLVHVLQTGLTQGSAGPATAAGKATDLRWYAKLVTLIVQDATLVDQPEQLVAHRLYDDLIYDAAMASFDLLMNATHEDFGSSEEMIDYANQVVDMLRGGSGDLDLIHAYLPFILGGPLINAQITLPQEQPHETLSLLAKARAKRADQLNENNQFVFDILDGLIDKALAHS